MLQWRNIIRALAAFAGVAAIATSAAAADPAMICYVYVSPIGDAGWTFQHDLGR